MKTPLDYQIAIAEAEGTLAQVAASFGIDRESVRHLRKLVSEYRGWETQVIAEARLPLEERRVEFMPLSRHTRNVLRREGIETGADMLGMAPGTVLSFRSAGKAVNADVQRYLDQQGRVKRNGRRPSLKSDQQPQPA